MEGYMFFMNTETATDTLREGVCFGIGEARYSDPEVVETLKDAPTIIEADTEPIYYPQVDGITPTVVAESEDKE